MTEYNPLANETHIHVYSVLGKYTTFNIVPKPCSHQKQSELEQDSQ